MIILFLFSSPTQKICVFFPNFLEAQIQIYSNISVFHEIPVNVFNMLTKGIISYLLKTKGSNLVTEIQLFATLHVLL